MSNPSVRGRRVAAELARLREATGLSREEVAERQGWSVSKVWRIETGRTRAHHGDVADLLDLYGVGGSERETLIRLAREARRRGWWHSYADVLAEGFDTYVDLEIQATSIRTYEAQLVPGLLQTEAYARAVLSAAWVTTEQDEISRRVAVRMRRQEVLASKEDGPQLWAVLDEAVVRRGIGGIDVMREQLSRLLEMAEQATVTLQVLPFSVGAHAAMIGAFVILGFPDPDRPVVYLETDTRSLYLEEAAELDRYMLVFDHLRAAALSRAESAAFVSQARREL